MILADLLRSDTGRPRITYYDETSGERIELSATALDNWVAKAANLMTEEYDVGPGTDVGFRLPDGHWRTLYWALAIFSLGATVDLTGEAEPLLTDAPVAGAGDMIIVTLPALARRHPDPLPAGALDEAAEIAGYPDVLLAGSAPGPADVAIRTQDGSIGYSELVPDHPAGSREHVTATGPDFLRRCLAVWAGDGSVVLVNGADPEILARRLAEEQVSRNPPP